MQSKVNGHGGSSGVWCSPWLSDADLIDCGSAGIEWRPTPHRDADAPLTLSHSGAPVTKHTPRREVADLTFFHFLVRCVTAECAASPLP